ncbi:AEC family transporter [Paracoccus methylarcula]|uniref:AEC family transporter n=1 Tax=Paracoccus methylarcula TaxID=72022 RepID=A0A422QU98_9RHOB|nr:AEC family transporter [Paracoccus methylarcula]RNF33579.1 AEC family transporter [Paracoccus methylarcula]
MLSNLLIVLPIFALVLTGWLARQFGALGPNATREVNRVVVYLALPALLFDITANAVPSEIWQPGFLVAFTAGCAVVFILTIGLRMRQGAPLADAAIDGLNTSYANTGFMGFPLLLAVIGETAMAATLVATIVTACVLFAIAIILIESGLQAETRRRDIARKICLSLVRNPLLIAPVLGGIVMATGLRLPEALDSYLKLLGGAASPCALIALGLFLADNSGRQPRAGTKVQTILVALKLIAQPAVTWIIAVPVLGLPAETAHIAVLLAALPTGTGPFMLAEFYQREALLTGRVILITTILSVGTLSLYLALAG